MPLNCSDVTGNIREMRHAGHSGPQSVAAAMSKERQCKKRSRRKARRRRRAERKQRAI
jgi:hypothetical protein